jgi:hypothetical protein
MTVIEPEQEQRPAHPANGTVKEDWARLARGRKRRPLEWIVERGIFITSLSAIVMIFLIFLFVGNKAWPILIGTADSSHDSETIAVADMEKYTPEQLRTYL